MNLLQRLKHTIEADLHQFFDKKESDNPLALLNQYIREAEKQTEETGKYLERQNQLKIKLEKELHVTSEMVEKRRSQIELALESGEADLAAFAQQEFASYSSRQQTITTSIQQVTEELFGLEQKYEEMKHKIKDMKVRQLQLMGKENVVRAHTKMDQMLDPENTQLNNRLETFEAMEQYIEKLGQKIEHEHEVTSMEQRLVLLEKQHQTKNTSPLA